MCVCPVLAPHGCPEPPALATRLSHHQSQTHDHSRRDAPFARRLHTASGTMPYQSAPRPARRSSTARGARGGTPRAAAAAHTPRHPTRSAAQPASSCAADLLDTQHTRTLAPPAHCAAHCTPRQPRSTRRGARGTPRALPGGSGRIASPLMPVHSSAQQYTHTYALRDRPRPEKTAALQHK